jgi:hypothetical protein
LASVADVQHEGVYMAGDQPGQFFTGLAKQGSVATLTGESATVRFDAVAGSEVERWHVTVADGEVTVTRQNRPADAVVRLRRNDLEEIVTGKLNAQAAVLRGLIGAEGSFAALMMFQRCLPGPPGSTGKAQPISSKTVMSWRRP